MKTKIIRWFWQCFPDCRFKRRKLGGLWNYYQTTLPMAAVWAQRETPREKLSCYAFTIRREYHGPIKLRLYI